VRIAANGALERGGRRLRLGLASDGSGFTTGAEVYVDGGASQV
jgi:hypothetical protein